MVIRNEKVHSLSAFSKRILDKRPPQEGLRVEEVHAYTQIEVFKVLDVCLLLYILFGFDAYDLSVGLKNDQEYEAVQVQLPNEYHKDEETCE